MPRNYTPNCILVVLPGRIGDTLLATPVVRALRANFPDSRIYFLASKAGAEVLKDNPHLNGILIHKNKHLFNYITALRSIRALKCDVVVDLRMTTGTGMLSLFSGAKYRLSYGAKRAYFRSAFYNLRQTEEPGYSAQGKLSLLRAIGIEDRDTTLTFPIKEEDRQFVSNFLASAEIDSDKPLVVMAPSAGKEEKTWKPERYAKLADMLAKSTAAQIVFVFGEDGTRHSRTIQAKAKAKHVIAPRLTLRQLTALFEKADLFIGACSAPRHFAALTNSLSLVLHREGSRPEVWTDPSGRHFWIGVGEPRDTVDKSTGYYAPAATLGELLVEPVFELAEKLITTAAQPRACMDLFSPSQEHADLARADTGGRR